MSTRTPAKRRGKTAMRIAGINFDHMHMGDLLRMAHEHPGAEIVGICDEDPARMQEAVGNFKIAKERVFTDYRRCLKETKPDLVLLCPATAHHARWVKRVAPFGTHILVEKPFAATLAQADEMIAAMKATGRQLVINWPLRWYPSHITAKRLIDEKKLGQVIEVHFYDGNRGPLWHGADKVETTPTAARKARSWFYSKSAGGGSMLDYLGYGTTLGTWFMNGRAPLEVTAIVDQPKGLEVDEHAVVVARYESGLSKFETRWGTFSDPWTHQPQPKCGFVIVGTKGTLSSYDFEPSVRLQTAENPEGKVIPVDVIKPPFHNPVAYVLDCIARGRKVDGPLSPAIARIGQQIVDTAVASARQRRTLPLMG
ncbi:MAG TPA: Gfo/Idh/MocA family oxidoreductase [Luteolibacter sp.]|nr:Gfo/Idh/MocA family oxidoreductase [Luteolibacter sp.]